MGLLCYRVFFSFLGHKLKPKGSRHGTMGSVCDKWETLRLIYIVLGIFGTISHHVKSICVCARQLVFRYIMFFSIIKKKKKLDEFYTDLSQSNSRSDFFVSHYNATYNKYTAATCIYITCTSLYYIACHTQHV